MKPLTPEIKLIILIVLPAHCRVLQCLSINTPKVDFTMLNLPANFETDAFARYAGALGAALTAAKRRDLE